MSRGLRILKRQPGSPSSCRVARRNRIIRKLDQAAFPTADTPSVQEHALRLGLLHRGLIRLWLRADR
jgi:hypothetical protein